MEDDRELAGCHVPSLALAGGSSDIPVNPDAARIRMCAALMPGAAPSIAATTAAANARPSAGSVSLADAAAHVLRSAVA